MTTLELGFCRSLSLQPAAADEHCARKFDGTPAPIMFSSHSLKTRDSLIAPRLAHISRNTT